jgi:eukaryotic-like serine/threonine-protein kinase
MLVPPPPLREKVPDILSPIEEVVMVALAKDPQQRFANVQAFANAFEQACQGTPVRPSTTQGQPLEPTILVNPPSQALPPTVAVNPSGHQPSIVGMPPDPFLPPTVKVPPPIVDPASKGTIGTTLLTFRHLNRVNVVAWSPDGRYIASASADKTVAVWNAVSGENICTYRGHSDVVSSIAWSPDGTRIASASDDQTVQVWQARQN